MDLKSKQEFVFFMRRALASDADDCYIELYNLLLRSFIAADVDFDGKVDAGEFTGMIESAAALLRKFDSDWWEDGKPREELFSAIDDNNDGAISFDEWLAFALSKYRGQVGTLPATPMDMKKDEFLSCCKEAATPGSEGAKAMYFFHWRAFQAADADRDGKVSGEEFNLMIDFCIDTPRRLGLSLPSLSAGERKEMFTAMDANGDGAISFDEWLGFSLTNIIAKIQ